MSVCAHRPTGDGGIFVSCSQAIGGRCACAVEVEADVAAASQEARSGPS